MSAATLAGVLSPSSSYRRPPLRPRQPVLWWFVCAGALMIGLGVLMGVLVTSVGERNTGEYALDVDLSHHRSVAGVEVARLIDVAGSPLMAPVVLTAIGYLLSRRADRAAGVWFIGLSVLGWFSVTVCKVAFHRHRPPTGAVHALVVERSADSFPSGHTALAAAIVTALAVVVRHKREVISRVLLVGLPVVAVVALSRLILGAHYLGDVLAAPFVAGGAVLVFTGLAHPFEARIRARINEAPLHSTRAGRG